MAGADRIAVAALLLLAMAACWVVAKRAAPLRGTGPGALTAQLLTPAEVSAIAPNDPWGAFLRIWRALQQGQPGYLTSHTVIRRPKLSSGSDWVTIAARGGPALGFPRLVSEHRVGPVATIDYVVFYAQAAASTPVTILPRSIELRWNGGEWLIRDPAALVSLLDPKLR